MGDIDLDKCSPISASVEAETEKALLLDYEGDQQWCPKSQMYQGTTDANDAFWIADWWLKKVGWSED